MIKHVGSLLILAGLFFLCVATAQFVGIALLLVALALGAAIALGKGKRTGPLVSTRYPVVGWSAEETEYDEDNVPRKKEPTE